MVSPCFASSVRQAGCADAGGAAAPARGANRNRRDLKTVSSADDEAAFAIFLVADLDAILPMYGPNSVHLATLDSGYMSQLLSTTAIEHQIGLCSIGSLNFTPVRHLFHLDEGQILLHSLLGGRIHPDISYRCSSAKDRSDGFDEGEI